MSAIQTGFNANSRIWFESTSNPLQSCPHYHFAMRIDSTRMHAPLTGSCDYHMTRRKKMDLVFMSVFVVLYYWQLCATLRVTVTKLSHGSSYLLVDGFVPYYPVDF